MLAPDASQRKVIEAPLSERRIVVAGPGSGKTTTAIRLILSAANRIDHHDATVLFISFSRAAISAALSAFGSSFEEILEDRLDVLSMTLDSLAWQLMEEDNLGTERVPDFDRVVNNATALLDSEYSGQLDNIVHLIVDEAQDLSLPRRRLLCKIIERLPVGAGVTVFGDPLQSIFDFLDIEIEQGVSSWEHLVESLTDLSVNAVYSLEGNYRAKRRASRSVAALASDLRAVSRRERTELIDELFAGFSEWSVDEFAERSSGWKGSTAVLARSNSEVMLVFGQLVSRGVDCAVRQAGTLGSPVATWVAELWRAVGGRPVTLDAFMGFAEENPGVEPEWFRLLLAESEHAGAVDWPGLARSFRAAANPLSPWFRRADARVVVSTIHQAKGLEWDNVGLVRCRELLTSTEGREPEPELAFVAASRARERIVRIQARAPFAKRARQSGVLYQTHPATNRLKAIGIDPPAISREFVGGSNGQRALADAGPNAMMEFELLASGRSEWPVYRCIVHSAAVGVTSDQFGKALSGLVPSGRGKWPQLGPVPLDGCQTEWETVGETRFWLRPRPFGMSTISSEW